MKKYLFGMLALVLAVGFSAFTTPKKATTKHFVFKIAQANTSSASGVQTLTNWDYQGELNVDYFLSCDDAQRDQACELIVDETDTYVPVSTIELKPANVAITAGQVGGSSSYVITSLTVGTPITNQVVDRDL